MRLKGAKQVHYDSGPNMTPLVDVVMVILIFLMLAGSFGGETTFLVSKQGIKKSGGTGRPLKPGEVPDTPLGIPDTFNLPISGDHSTRHCQVAWRKDKRIGVAFR